MNMKIGVGIGLLWGVGLVGEFSMRHMSDQEAISYGLSRTKRKVGVVICQTFEALAATLSLFYLNSKNITKRKFYILATLGSIGMMLPTIEACIEKYMKPSLFRGCIYIAHNISNLSFKMIGTVSMSYISYSLGKKINDRYFYNLPKKNQDLHYYAAVSAFVCSIILGTFSSLPGVLDSTETSNKILKKI